MAEATMTALTTEDSKIALLQLQCIIDAKNREIQLLRERLSGQEDIEVVTALQTDVSRLRAEVQRLTQENKALRSQSDGATTLDGRRVTLPEPSTPTQRVASSSGSNIDTVRSPGPSAAMGSAPALRPTATVDPGALVEKLRGLVTGLVAEAMAAQQQQQQQQPLLQQRESPPTPQGTTSRESQPAVAQQPSAITTNTGVTPSPRPTVPQQVPIPAGHPYGQAGHSVIVWVPAAPAAAPLQSAASPPNTSASISDPTGVGAAPLPGIQVIVQPLPSAPLGPQAGWQGVPLPTALVNAPTGSSPAASGQGAEGSTALAPELLPSARRPEETATATPSSGDGASASAAGHNGHSLAAAPTGPAGAGACVGGGGSSSSYSRSSTLDPSLAPAVLELNVDGKVVFVDRAVLETQAPGSKLHEAVIRRYHSLPLDSQGRPYLSYEPRVFEVLLSFLKERWLFGAAAPSRDWPQVVRSLGVSPLYFEQVASHFGLLDIVASRPLPAEVALPPTTSTSVAASESSSFRAHALPPQRPQPDAGLAPATGFVAQQVGGGETTRSGPCSTEALSDGAGTLDEELGRRAGQIVAPQDLHEHEPFVDRKDAAPATAMVAPGGMEAGAAAVAGTGTVRAAEEAPLLDSQAVGSSGFQPRADAPAGSSRGQDSGPQPGPESVAGQAPSYGMEPSGSGSRPQESSSSATVSPRTSRIPTSPSQRMTSPEQLAAAAVAVFGGGSSVVAREDASASQGGAAARLTARAADAAVGSEDCRMPPAVAGAPYRMPSLYTLLAQRQQAEE